ncbi:hypothetical protein [Saccharopolyspora sp. NPDC002686]|uniref:hypothetical protein n=1 Tax=Saccharopolyspora sp. NPDC002686 TaxID=3154541 RepID=UPI0033283AD6
MSYVDRMHDLLLHVAGRVPDEFMATARRQLAAGMVGDVALAVCLQLVQRKVPVTIEQAGLLSELVDDSATALFSGIRITEHDFSSPWRFVWNPERPNSDIDDATAALVAVLDVTPAARGLWLSWRMSWSGGPLYPVYVVEADGGDHARLSAELHVAVADRLDVPRIEVVGLSEAPSYQRAARNSGELVWSVAEPSELFIANVFNRVDRLGGPSLDDHPRLTEPADREHVLAHLRAGQVLVSTDTTMIDVVQPGRGSVVPIGFRTDGVWLWPEAIAYYLEEYGLAPDERFLAHIRTAERPLGPVSTVIVDRALRQLLDPSS